MVTPLMSARAIVAQFVERTVTAFVIAGAAVLVAARTNSFPVTAALDAGALAALVALISTAVLLGSPINWRNPLVDLVWRAGMMGLQAFVGAVATAHVFGVIELNWPGIWHVTVLAVVGSLAKNIGGIRNPFTVGASPLIRRGSR